MKVNGSKKHRRFPRYVTKNAIIITETFHSTPSRKKKNEKNRES